ncbi:MAG TPA: sigma-70 family RNA polymerase sigma factor [Steroidobacteraceae bacterium]|jgi:RNA polymerase sigma-70 factor (ECF subfamily)
MSEQNVLAEQFQASRARLRAVAYRMLGSANEADDAVQEAWLRLARADSSEVDNLGGWLTTVVARVCLDMLRARKTRREEPLATDAVERLASPGDAESEMQFADGIGLALLVVLDTLAPNERVAFVLHDLFNLQFDVIAPIINRSLAATRQLASRARRRVQGSPEPDGDRDRQRELVSAFRAASREGNFSALLAVLDPEVVLRADAAAVMASVARREHGAPSLTPETRGAAAVAKIFEGRAQAARQALVDGGAGMVFAPGGEVQVVFEFVIEQGRILEISLIADPANISSLQLSIDV